MVYKAADVHLNQMTASDFCDNAFNTDKLVNAFVAIVEQESPVSFDVLSKELITIAGITKMTPKLRARCKDLLMRAGSRIRTVSQKLNPASEEDDEVYILWKDGTELGKVMDHYRIPADGEKARKATDIPVQEAACAALYLAKSQYGMPYESLIVETAKALGLSRVPADSDNYILGKRAVDYCICQELLFMDDDCFVKAE